MFTNLIESSSHAKEFKRRGSFLLFTTATYVVLFVITGVVSIYAYDTHLEEQNLEVVMLLPPQEIVPDTPRPVAEPPRNTSNNVRSAVPERAIAMLSVEHPEVVPDRVSAERNTVLPLPPGPVRITGRDYDPPPIGGGRSNNGGAVVTPSRIVIDDDPPPAPQPTPVVPKIVKVSEILNSRAISLPKPPYPQMAKQIRVQGIVTVQVLIDEVGRVLSAKAMSGHPLLVPDSQRAALQARFSPTTINGQPVKVSGVITYNFVLP
ncbi:MAG TPA: energy transducer TonB [Pyrinomonadaceae bacterium]|jgi:TonB family C-terminal domain|nr:energy transducer TonB [Pyrinomonadaceae bacterium]